MTVDEKIAAVRSLREGNALTEGDVHRLTGFVSVSDVHSLTPGWTYNPFIEEWVQDDPDEDEFSPEVMQAIYDDRIEWYAGERAATLVGWHVVAYNDLLASLTSPDPRSLNERINARIDKVWPPTF